MRVKTLENFWKKKINLLNWEKKPKKILNRKKGNKNKWYEDGKLNLSFECIDHNINKGLGNKTAIIFIENNGNRTTLSYRQLLDCVEKFCYFLKKNYKIGGL